MPAGDQTGPLGKGPATGRGAGQCATGQANSPRLGLGFGRGRGQGRGQGRCRGVGVAYVPPTREQQLAALKAQSAMLESELDAVRQQIGTLGSES